MRHIDADKFIAELEQEKTVALEFEDGVAVYEIEHMMNLIGMQPTADVVPKSEVERLQAELDSKQFRCDSCDRIMLTGAEHRACVKQAKAEVAIEIFEEIEFEIHNLDFEKEETRAIAIEGIIANIKREYTEYK